MNFAHFQIFTRGIWGKNKQIESESDIRGIWGKTKQIESESDIILQTRDKDGNS